MAVRLVRGLLIPLLLYEHTSGEYCRYKGNASIQFCQSGIISGSNVYINGSSVKTREELKDRGCVCYLEQIGNRDIRVNGGGSCLYCGLQVRVGDVYFRFNPLQFPTYGWGSTALNDTKFIMTLGLDGNTDRLNTAFCITIEENHLDSSIVLTLTCEDNVSRSSTAISTSPTVITSRNMVHHKNTSQPLTRRETRTSLAKTETANTVEASAGNINVTNGPKANNTHTLTTITTNDPGESRFHTQKDEIVVGAAVGGSCGGVVLVIVITVIIFICYKRRIKNKYRQSKEPASVYTELEFGSRDGQNDNPVYSAIEPQQIYINIVH